MQRERFQEKLRKQRMSQLQGKMKASQAEEQDKLKAKMRDMQHKHQEDLKKS